MGCPSGRHLCRPLGVAAYFAPSSLNLPPLAPSKRDTELLLKLIANLNMLLRDENVNVVKKAILAMTQLYKVALQVSWSHLNPLAFVQRSVALLSCPPSDLLPSEPLMGKRERNAITQDSCS